MRHPLALMLINDLQKDTEPHAEFSTNIAYTRPPCMLCLVWTHTKRVPFWGGSQNLSHSVGSQPPTEGQGASWYLLWLYPDPKPLPHHLLQPLA